MNPTPSSCTGTIAKLVDWLKNYKIPDGKGQNKLVSETPSTKAEALKLIEETHQRYNVLKQAGPGDSGFYLGRRSRN